jgi:hypothetical protein
MKNAVFWGVAPCRSARGFFTLKMEGIRSSETSVQSTTSTRRHTLEDGILQEKYIISFGPKSGDGKVKEGKAIRVTGHGGPQDCETSRLPHVLDSRLTDGGEFVSLTRRPPFTPMKIRGTHFC